MIRSFIALVLAGVGLFVFTPANAQSDGAAPAVAVAPDGTVTVTTPGGTSVAPPGGAGGLLLGSGGTFWSELWGSMTLGPSDRQLSGRLFSEGVSAGNSQDTSVVIANPRRSYLAACVGCSAAQGSSNEKSGSSNAWSTPSGAWSSSPGALYAAPFAGGGNASNALSQDFVQPFALSRSRALQAGGKTNLDFPKDFKKDKGLAASSDSSVNKHSEAAQANALGGPGRSENKLPATIQTNAVVADAQKPHAKPEKTLLRSEKTLSKVADATQEAASSPASGRKTSQVAEVKTFGGGPGKSESKHAALSASSIGSSASSGARGAAGQAPEPEMWFFSLLGLLGASFLRRKKS